MFSFAMFFLLLIYEDSLKRRGGTYDICKHPLHREHHICFLKGNMLASFKVSRIQLRDLVMPSPQLQMPSKDPTKEELRSDLNDINIHRDNMFTQINEKLSKIKVDTSSQILITSITALIGDSAKDYESLQKLSDGIFTNIKDNTQLAEMRISILMLKVQLLKTISTWKQKLAHLGDLKKKEEKSAHSALSRHPSGNNVSTLTTSALTQQSDMALNLAPQTPSESSKCQSIEHSKLHYPDVDIIDQNNETKDILTTHSDSSIEKNIEDVTTSGSVIKENKTVEALKSSSIANMQPLSNQIIAQSSKHKWHSRDSNISTSNFQLSSPFPATLHADLYLKPGVLVDESQPSSIIAYTLASNDYRNFVETSTTQFLRDNEDKQQKSGIDIHKKENLTTEKHDSSKAKDSDDQSKHFKHSFRDDSCDFFCKVLFAHDFEIFREKTLSSKTDLILSLSKCSRFKASGGKSGVKFYKTADDRFLLKELNRRTEARDVSTFIPKYLSYMTRAHEGAGNSLLTKIIGVFDVGFKNHVTGSQSGIMFILMENLTYGRSNITGSYDLKGSRRNRLVDVIPPPDGDIDGEAKVRFENDSANPSDCNNLVLMDENLVNVLREKPFYINEDSQRILSSAIKNDTAFLEANEMMDYSLLVAIDGQSNELVLGIIDYVRVYTWDKQLECLIKSTGGMFAGGKAPTVVAPPVYKKRFEHSMAKYFTFVPNYWYHNNCTTKDITTP